jgi:SAM-dependent methyltransferase
MGSPRRVLDPAAGRGEFITAIEAADRWAVELVDQSSGWPESIHSQVGDILTVDLPERAFDGIFVSNLLEHLASPDDVVAFLERMRVLLAPGGCLAVMGPNFKYCASQYFDCADHRLALSHIAVEEFLATTGFETTATYPRFLPYSFRGSLPPKPWLVERYLRTKLVWRFLGKQFLIYAHPSA